MAYDPARGLLNGSALVGGLIEQGQRTQSYVDGMFDTAARRKAGAAIAKGDNQTAAGLLGARGDLEGAATLHKRASTQSSLQAIDAGNFDRAKEESAAAGDTGMYGAAQGAEDDDRKARVGWLGNAADALLQIKDPNVRHQKFQEHIAPTLKAMGMSDADIAKVDQQQLTDEGLQSFKASLGLAGKGEVRQDPNTGDLISIDPRTGAATVVYKAGQKKDWKEFKRADGSSYWKDMNSVGGGAETDVDPTAASGGGTPEVKGGAYDRIATIAEQAGAKPEEATYLKRLAQVESGANPKAKNGSSTGVFQFHPDTFASVGGTDINSVEDQTKAALELARRDRAMLEKVGVPITDANLYIMHQQGAGGGRALLTAPPEVNAVEALTPVYGSAKMAKKAIVGNGGSADMTAGEFVDYWRNRWAGGPKAATGQAKPASVTVEGDAAPLAGRMATASDKQRLGLPTDAPYWIDEKGKPSPVGGEKPNKPLTEYQGKSVEYLAAAMDGNERMNELARAGIYKPRTATDSLFTREKDGVVRLVARTDEDRRFVQASKEWLLPILRKDTGAAVTDGEVLQYMDTYIPKYEDSPAVMWQKAKARDAKMRALHGANKVAYEETFGTPPKWQVLTDPRGKPGAKAPSKPTEVKAASGKVVKIEVVGD